MNMNVSLTEELVSYIKSKVETGRYASSSEVVREALRLMEAKDRDAWQIPEIEAGLEEAKRGDFASDAEVASVLARYKAKRSA